VRHNGLEDAVDVVLQLREAVLAQIDGALEGRSTFTRRPLSMQTHLCDENPCSFHHGVTSCAGPV